MLSIEKVLLSAINNHSTQPIVVAYSGGVDSQVLLHALIQLKQTKKLANSIIVCHINHGISQYSDDWQLFAQQQCQYYQVKLVVNAVNVKEKAQQSLEALARDARYKALQSVNEERSIILTGHHSDDQSETLLLALKRGAGLKGLSSMPEISQLEQHLLVRPFLHVSREVIIAYAQEHNLKWIEDDSNDDTRFDRNFIRQEIMPLLTKRWPSINKTINRSAQHCMEGQLLLDELAQQDLNECHVEVISLSVEKLKKLSQARFNNLLRFFMASQQCLMPSTEQLKQVYQQIFASEDKNPSVKVGDHYFRRYKNALHLTSDFQDVSQWQCELNLAVNSEVKLPDNLGQISIKIDALPTSEYVQIQYFSAKGVLIKSLAIPISKKEQKVMIKFEHNNPRCLPDYRQHSRDLKKVLQELNIAPWQRKRIPFLYYGESFVAAIGHFVCK